MTLFIQLTADGVLYVKEITLPRYNVSNFKKNYPGSYRYLTATGRVTECTKEFHRGRLIGPELHHLSELRRRLEHGNAEHYQAPTPTNELPSGLFAGIGLPDCMLWNKEVPRG